MMTVSEDPLSLIEELRQKMDLKTCLICGSTEKVEMHHIIPKSWQKLRKEPCEDSVSLCRKHHRLMPPFITFTSFMELAKVATQLNKELNPRYYFNIYVGFFKSGRKYYALHVQTSKPDQFVVVDKEPTKWKVVAVV